MIAVGTRAPDFTLRTQDDQALQLLSELAKRNVLIVFIPAAFTPICSTEVPALSALFRQFLDTAKTLPVVITADNVPSNREWMRQLGSKVPPVLSDYEPKGKVSKAYGAWNETDGIPDRASVLVGRDGLVKYAESVTKFGKRSVPSLLAISQRAAGMPVTAPASAKMPLDLPILFVSKTCPFCLSVQEQLNAMQLETRVVVRVVDGDSEAVQWLLGIQPSGDVPVLVDGGSVYVGAINAVEGLKRVAMRSGAGASR
jgi:peroxiredoxin/glutaredoxin